MRILAFRDNQPISFAWIRESSPNPHGDGRDSCRAELSGKDTLILETLPISQNNQKKTFFIKLFTVYHQTVVEIADDFYRYRFDARL
jgi:hypothetical protein